MLDFKTFSIVMASIVHIVNCGMKKDAGVKEEGDCEEEREGERQREP